MRKYLLLLVFCFGTLFAFGQKNISFKDSLDHKFDLSDWVLKANGFIPIPYVITEPALGNFGGALFTVFIDQNTPYQDSIDAKLVTTHVKPNIYGGGGGYTANNSWFAGGLASGVIKKWRANYRVATAYADLNLSFYQEFPTIGEQSFEFNIRTLPIMGQLVKQIGRSPWYVGLDYLFLKTELGNQNPNYNSPKEANSIVSKMSLLVDYDSRDNIFTPNSGFRWNTLLGSSSEIIGSDYNYTSINSAAFWYLPVSKNMVSGFRAEYQQVFGDVPFYMKPYVNMRGIPVMRYQGDIIALAETEWRWDFTPRYSLVAFGGAAKALPENSSFQEEPWRVSGGMGGRYLIARKLKLRMGLDIAHGPEDWAYYIVFGTNWNR